jgi:hypothetical protein
MWQTRSPTFAHKMQITNPNFQPETAIADTKIPDFAPQSNGLNFFQPIKRPCPRQQSRSPDLIKSPVKNPSQAVIKPPGSPFKLQTRSHSPWRSKSPQLLLKSKSRSPSFEREASGSLMTNNFGDNFSKNRER